MDAVRWALMPVVIMAASLPLPAAGAGIEARRAQLLAVAVVTVAEKEPDWRPRPSDCFPLASALFALGHDTEARRIAHKGLDALVPGNSHNRWHRDGNAGFVAWPGIDCYVRWKDRMDEGLRARFREIYGAAVFYRQMSTSNHRIMAAVTRYLAGQEWGQDAFHPDPAYQQPDGGSFNRKDPTGELEIRTRCRVMLEDAPGEYASRPYGRQNLLPILSIADGARDPELAALARAAYERAILQLAPCWLGGHLATFSTRSYPDVMTRQPWGLGALLWIYFGGLEPRMGGGYEWMAAVSDYRPPPLAEQAAVARDRPYVHRARVNDWALYHFSNRSYILFSRSPKPGKPWMNPQVYPCGLMWEEADITRASQLWITHPWADETADRRRHPDGIHTHGVTRHERQMQAEGTLLAVYRIPADDLFPYVLGYVPGGHRAWARSADRRSLYLHYGAVLVGIRSSHPFDWEPGTGVRAPAHAPFPGESEFRIPSPNTSVAIETAHPSEFTQGDPAEQLRTFQNACERAPAPGDGLYTDRHGRRLELAFEGEDKVDGRVVDYASWPLLENPWMRQQPGGPLQLLSPEDGL